eukprot:6181797-Ditylum_brightwellii.AAC.2
MMGCKKYVTEALTYVQTLFGVLSKHDTPMFPSDHPEMDDSPTLNDVDHQKYQMLIDRVLYVFGYLKKRPNQRIRIDLCDPVVVKNGAEVLLDIDIAELLFDELALTAYVNSDHAHDKLTKCSITGKVQWKLPLTGRVHGNEGCCGGDDDIEIHALVPRCQGHQANTYPGR